MDFEKIITLITQQIPLLLMAINNGRSVWDLMPLLIIPIIIYFVQSVPLIIKFFSRERIPKHYVHYYLDDGSSMAIIQRVNFNEKISMFLTSFHPTSIKTGSIKNYNRQQDDPNLLFKCYYAIISPDNSYFCKFIFDENIISKLKETGFTFPSSMNLDNLLKDPIYISIETKTEKVVTDGNRNKDKSVQDVTKDHIKISATNIAVAENFIYIIVNHELYKSSNIDNFKLMKTIYYYNSKIDYSTITSLVNVIKNYKNVFLTKKNHSMIVDTIIEWNSNKKAHLIKGIPDKLGFFLTGAPGCGKSSLIYAIANETKKHIVSINMQDMTNKSFISLMSGIENKIVVFDDVDSYKFAQKRIQLIDAKKDKNQMNQQIQLALLANSSDDKSLLMSKFNREMTLDVFLEVLDGYNYLNNCIVILTSNHPELLDQAVTRPGRVDHVIEFDLCDQYQFQNIFNYFVGTNYKTINPSFKFTENTYSTSYIINTIILPNKNNPRKILQLLQPK